MAGRVIPPVGLTKSTANWTGPRLEHA